MIQCLLLSYLVATTIPEPRSGQLKVNENMLLSQMREGEEGTIVKVGGDGAFRRRLLEMGFLRGARLTVEKYAPLKDPLEVVVGASHVSLRVEEAAWIEMKPAGERPPEP